MHETGRELTDTSRYLSFATEIGKNGLVPYRDFELEYPPGALPVFLLPAIPPGSGSYYWLFIVQMALLGALGVLATAGSLQALARAPRRKRLILALLVASPVAFASVLLTRFDLLPAALVALATYLVLTARPRAGALALGLAAAAKVYPLVLLPLFATWVWRRTGPREAAVVSAIALGVTALVYVPFVLVASDGVWSSAWRQLSRPLQIESLGAGVLVLLHHLAGLEVVVETSYGSDNLGGGTAALVATVLSALGGAALVWVWIEFARGEADRERLVRYGAAALLALVAFGKVGSPQFLVWLLFPLALVGGRRGALAGGCFAVAALATAVWFPWRYFDLPVQLDPLVASLVVVRGLALVAAFAVLAYPFRGRL